MNTTASKPGMSGSPSTGSPSTGNPSTGNPSTGNPITGSAADGSTAADSAAADSTAADGSTATGSPQSVLRPRPEPLSRPVSNRMLAGVAAGIARHLGVDVTAVRVVFAVLTVIGGAGVPIYLAGWLLIPNEGSGASIADGLIRSWHDRRR